MKRIKIDSVEPGDILFTARPGSKLVRFATRGIVSHALICVQQGSFIELYDGWRPGAQSAARAV